MSSFLLIGIGSTGLSMLEQVEQFVYEFTRQNKPGPNVELMYLETDLEKKPVRTASGKTSITQIPLSLGDNAVDIRQLKATEHIDSSWIPESTDVLKNLNGAGGMPTYGRLALWGGDNYKKLKNEIQRKYADISGDDKTQIIILGSLTGGTGSGLCVDVPYLVRDVTRNSNVTAIFLLPDGKSFGMNKSLHENSHSAMSALDYYYKNTYKTTFPDNVTIEDERAPYGLVQYLSQDFSSAKASIASLDELIRVAGVIVGMNILGTGSKQATFSQVIGSRRVDRGGAGTMGNNISNGFLMIQFPKAQLEEILSLSVARELLSDLINPTDYIDRLGNKKNILGDEVLIKNEIYVKAEQILKACSDAIDSLTTPKGTTIKEAISGDAESLINKDFEQPSGKRFLYDLFSSKSAGNYYEQVFNNGASVRNILVESIQDYIKELTDSRKNLTVTKLGIETFGAYLKKIIGFYEERYGISGESATWDGVLQKHIEALLSEMQVFKLALMSNKYAQYILSHLLDLVKVHCSVEILKAVVEHLGKPDSELLSSEGKRLPNLKSVERRIALIQTLIDGDGDDMNYTLNRRENELVKSLDTFASCFKMVYRTGARASDLIEAKSNYLKDDSQRITHAKLTGTKLIWDFFEDDANSVYSNVVQNCVDEIKMLNLFANTSLESILREAKLREDRNLSGIITILNSPVEIISQQIPAMVKLKDGVYSFGQDPNSKLVLLSSDHKKYAPLFPNCNFSSTSSNVTDLSSLQNTIILYQEYGFMGDVTGETFNPLVHIGQMDDTRTYLNRAIQKENYCSRKVAYLSEEQYKQYL